MKKQKALKSLSEKLNDLQNQNFDPDVWTQLTSQLIMKIFPISFQDKIESIKEIDYVIYSSMADQGMQNRKKVQGISKAKTYIDAYIDEINNHGMEKGSINNNRSFWGNLSTFWGIVAAVVLAAFMLGMYIGNTKFDKDKNDLYNQVIALSSDTTKNIETIKIKSKIINQMDSILNIKSDSIKQLMQENNATYYHIGKMNQKK